MKSVYKTNAYAAATADVEVIPMQKVNEAYERLVNSDVKYRFAIDMASLNSEEKA